jgi:cystathionine beta-lyase
MHYNFDEVIHRENTMSVKYDLRKAIFKNETVVPMWVADMDFRTPDFIIRAIQQRLDHGILGYTYIAPSFYESVVNWNLRRHAWKIEKEWISFSPGVVPALSLLVMAFTKPGDGVIIQPPVYFPFFSSVENHHRKLILNPLHFDGQNYTMDFEDLEAKIDSNTRMLFLCNPHNPTGNVWPYETLKRLGEICVRHNVLLISDEIHSDLIFKGHRHIPVAGISDEIAHHTITCNSPSKTFNLAGLSTAYLIISNPQLKEQYDKVLDHVHVGAGNTLGFVAAEAAYNFGDQWLDQLMKYLSGNLAFMKEYFEQHISAIQVLPPEATYLIWLNCRKLGMTPGALKSFMIHDAGLGLNDGPQFGRGGESFQRINIACPKQILSDALEKLQIAVTKYFNK